jgi:hypothetical protein
MADNKVVGRVLTMYAPGTTARIKEAGDEVAVVLRKPRGAVTKAEIEKALDDVERLRSAEPALTNVEELNRLSLHSALTTRAASEGLMSPAEIMARRDTLAWALGAPGGGGAGRAGAIKSAGKGPMLPRTSSPSIKVPPKSPATTTAPAAAPSGVVIKRPVGTTIGNKISRQTQFRHVKDRPEWVNRGKGGYFEREEDAQKVLDAYHSGDAKVLGTTSQGNTVVEYKQVTGFNNNPGKGFIDQPTNTFMIKAGTARVSIVPVSPGWSP